MSMMNGKRLLLNQKEIVTHTPWKSTKSVQLAHHEGFPVEYINGRPWYDPDLVAMYFKRRHTTPEDIKKRHEDYKKRAQKRLETMRNKAS